MIAPLLVSARLRRQRHFHVALVDIIPVPEVQLLLFGMGDVSSARFYCEVLLFVYFSCVFNTSQLYDAPPRSVLRSVSMVPRTSWSSRSRGRVCLTREKGSRHMNSIEALIITTTVLGVSYYKYSRMGPQTLF